MSVAEEILKRKLKGFYQTLKSFGYLDKVIEAMEEYEEYDRAKLHTMVVGPSSGKTTMYDAIAKYAGDKNIVVIGDLPMEMDSARVIEKINESHPELRASKEFKIEALPELTMPFVNERDWNDNRPFYQKLDKNKKRKYGKQR